MDNSLYTQTLQGHGKQYNLPYDVLDFGFDSDWRTGSVRLRSIGTRINIHPNARFMDRGVDHFLKYTCRGYFNRDMNGECRMEYNKDARLFEVEIVRKEGLDKDQTEFVRGHEEGHAMVFLGQMAKLFEEAQRLGLSFDFLSQCESRESDASAYRLLSFQGTESDAERAWGKKFILGEVIANVGGLIALIKSKAEHNLVFRVRNGIQGMDVRIYPLY